MYLSSLSAITSTSPVASRSCARALTSFFATATTTEAPAPMDLPMLRPPANTVSLESFSAFTVALPFLTFSAALEASVFTSLPLTTVTMLAVTPLSPPAETPAAPAIRVWRTLASTYTPL